MKKRSAKKNRANVVKQLAESQMEELTDKEFEERFIEEHYPEKHKTAVKSPRRWSVVMSALACLVIVAIVIPCAIFLQPSPQTDPVPPDSEAGVPELPEEEEPPHFGWTPNDTYSRESDLDEVNAELQGYRFNPDRVNSYMKLTFDKETDEPLYYTLSWDNYDELDAGLVDFMEACSIYVIVNEDFEGYTGWKEIYDTTLTINGLTVECRQKEDHLPEEGIYGYICYGLIKIGDVRIYITNYTYDSYYDINGFEKFVSELLVPVSETEPAYVSE